MTDTNKSVEYYIEIAGDNGWEYSGYTMNDWKEEIVCNDDCTAQWLRKYINFNDILLDQWRNDEIAIVHYEPDHKETHVLLENISDKYPIWKDREWEFLTGHPDNTCFTIIDLHSKHN
jgi:hypothetical protein